jgi:hypothetical protein
MATTVSERPLWQKIAFPPFLLIDKYHAHQPQKSFFGGEDRMNIKIALMILFVIFLIVLIVYQIGSSEVVYTCVIATGIAYTVIFVIDKLCEKKSVPIK